jgi:glycosyltransferase involved in cell wall biosynthesis
MRIHLVSEHASPLAVLGGVDAGGQNVYVAALARGLADLGAQVVVHTRRDDPSLAREVTMGPGVVVDHVDAGPPEPVPKDELLPHMSEFADELERRWSDEPPDVVHAHFWMSGLAAATAARRVHVPVALTYHALGVEKRQYQGSADTSPTPRLEIERWLACNVDHVIATTKAERRTLVGLGANPSRVSVIPCGVDLDLFQPFGAVWPPLDGLERVVCVSRLVPRKGLADVIVAVADVPHVQLLVAGGPPAAMLHDDEHARALLDLIDALGIGDRVELLGALDHARVPDLLRSAAVVCCTPWYEPFGMVAVEAMACGVPVVATRVGGLAETVLDGRTGVLVPPRQPARVRAAIAGLTRPTARTRRMQATCIRRAQRYGWATVARRSYQVLKQLAVAGPRWTWTDLPDSDTSAVGGWR